MTVAHRRPGWLLDEPASAGREHFDANHARHYDAKEDAGAGEEVALLKTLGLDPASQVVELGPGTGQFTLAVAPECARVVAVDVSPIMLDVLRAKLADAQLDNVRVVQAGFLTYQHDGPPADVVYSRYSLHHLPDFWKVLALRRAHDMLRPGGILRLWDVVYNFEPTETEERIEAWCASVPETTTSDDDWNRADLEEHVRDEHSTYSWLLEPMMERVGFTIADATYTADGMFAKYVAQRHSYGIG